jgi:formylglycine-generating enzyme required for sulfatase activity
MLVVESARSLPNAPTRRAWEWLRWGQLGAGLLRAVFLAAVVSSTSGCRREDSTGASGTAPSASAAPVLSARSSGDANAGTWGEEEATPRLLYLPESGDTAPSSQWLPWDTAPPRIAAPSRSGACPPEMVEIQARFCIDRYEATLVDHPSGRRLSPYFVPRREEARAASDRYANARAKSATALGRSLDAPTLPDWQRTERYEPRASVAQGEVPNGYVSGELAAIACRHAGKRLCTESEWVTACRGQDQRDFPYGKQFEEGACNVRREAHPAQLLHGNASIHHLDPRLNLVRSGSEPLLRPTGSLPSCASAWGTDAVYDMVGNLDEWVDDPRGLFLGGFYSRGTQAGCLARISAHPPEYFDYSLGVRCCLSLRP